MARKNYTDEFRRQAVDLYRSTPGATLRGIAADLGISRHTLQEWIRALDPAATIAAGSSSRPGRAGRAGRGHGGSPQDELTALRAR
jgi:transposase